MIAAGKNEKRPLRDQRLFHVQSMKELNLYDLDKTAGGGKPNTPNAPDTFYEIVNSMTASAESCLDLRKKFLRNGSKSLIPVPDQIELCFLPGG